LTPVLVSTLLREV